MDIGVPRDEIDRILYDRKVFLGIKEVLGKYLDNPLSGKGEDPR
jgi:hypothetical protein